MTRHRRSQLRQNPYRHLLIEELLEDSQWNELLNLLEATEWTESQQEFFSFGRIATAKAFNQLAESVTRTGVVPTLETQFTAAFGIEVLGPVRYSFQRYTPGSGIGPHTDRQVGSLRFVLNLTRNWRPDYGGIWLLSNRSNPSSDTAFVVPLNNSGFAFVPNERTFHALSDRTSNQAFAVIFEFAFAVVEHQARG